MNDNYVILMQWWSSIAEDINQLALAALILPIFFLRKIFAVPEVEPLIKHINKWLYFSWFCLFATIFMCLVYKSVATCLMGKEMELGEGLACNANPVYVFYSISLFFVLGVGFLFLGYFMVINRGKDESG